MKNAQRNAVERHRRRRKDRGIQRLEISVPKSDKPLFCELAAILRAGGERADRLRTSLRASVEDAPKRTFLDFLSSAPDVELEPPPSSPAMRDVDF